MHSSVYTSGMTSASHAVASPASTGGPFRAAVVGASGYAGGETLRLLSAHPGIEVTTVAAHSSAGQRLSEVAPHIDLSHDPIVAETERKSTRLNSSHVATSYAVLCLNN